MEVGADDEGSEAGRVEYAEAQEEDWKGRYYVLKIRRVLASLRPHRCSRCGRLYLPGSFLQYKVYVYEGEFFHGYTCPACQGGEAGGKGWID